MMWFIVNQFFFFVFVPSSFLIFRTIRLGLKTGYDNVRQIPDTPCIHLVSLHTVKRKKKIRQKSRVELKMEAHKHNAQ
ncbi:Uncharacterized protein APZ42_004660 [Daphnia magna]|uniref:Uncharacterized protein n=1 Tax=Daphnia magna TaxID=35525 RepID=A0A164GWZ3_9CRUS|nr:Uncharacterized protein APZ42_004660 [Daphnia magna]